jgi:Fic-DOC domain mobile mystery protein B
LGLKISYPEGATPLDPDEARELIPQHIATQAQLNEWEHQNIVEAQLWAFNQSQGDVLTIEFIRMLHQKMFGNTWRWAGSFRLTERNIGVAPEQILVRLRDLCGDTVAQRETASMPLLKMAATFHHRLVLIHPFPNGNGRFSRLMADLMLARVGVAPFEWGGGDLNADGSARSRYISALRSADSRDYGPLFKFLEIP